MNVRYEIRDGILYRVSANGESKMTAGRMMTTAVDTYASSGHWAIGSKLVASKNTAVEFRRVDSSKPNHIIIRRNGKEEYSVDIRYFNFR